MTSDRLDGLPADPEPVPRAMRLQILSTEHWSLLASRGGTQLRLDSASHHDVMSIIGMNRIRAKYLELAPDLTPLFVMGTTDDVAGIVRTMAVAPGRSIVANFLSATPVQVAILNAVLFGSVIGLLALQLGAGGVGPVVVGALAAVGLAALFAYLDQRMLRRVIADHRPLFPTLDEGAASE